MESSFFTISDFMCLKIAKMGSISLANNFVDCCNLFYLVFQEIKYITESHQENKNLEKIRKNKIIRKILRY